MSVFRTRVVFFLGLGAGMSAPFQGGDTVLLTILILRHVEAAQKHNCLLTIVSTNGLKSQVGVEHVAVSQYVSSVQAERREGTPVCLWRITDRDTHLVLTSNTLPHPPNRSLPQP